MDKKEYMKLGCIVESNQQPLVVEVECTLEVGEGPSLLVGVEGGS